MIQDEATSEKITYEVTRILENTFYHQSICEEFTSIKKKLAEQGASRQAAQITPGNDLSLNESLPRRGNNNLLKKRSKLGLDNE